MQQYLIKNQQQTIDLGQQISSQLNGGDIVLLHGELGAGKTTLTKGIAIGFGITDETTSPTFTLINTYQIRNSKFEIRNFVHIDTYRLKDENQLIEIGVEDYLGDKNTVCVIEWPEKIEGLLQGRKVKRITIEYSDEGRNVKVEE